MAIRRVWMVAVAVVAVVGVAFAEDSRSLDYNALTKLRQDQRSALTFESFREQCSGDLLFDGTCKPCAASERYNDFYGRCAPKIEVPEIEVPEMMDMKDLLKMMEDPKGFWPDPDTTEEVRLLRQIRDSLNEIQDTLNDICGAMMGCGSEPSFYR